MGIKIKKKTGQVITQREVVKTVNVVDPFPTPEETHKTSMEAWRRQPAVGAKPKECGFCGKVYMVPCSKDEHTDCLNWQFLQSQAKEHA